ncbi:hypothetical protein Rhopal_007507-T1 [Rhodotorula paludigena]|uniref:F-box domain-containing protein n=1 Tax=Rhodotorula paludigena TaxID=86838 RepID=A0AAV5GY28_9BASI|nr:hypothetical protein Rhopal_007507-T1 [Rhodotorula paludigena]
MKMDPAATTSAGAGGQPARRPTSLLDLPDELIRHIFQLLHESLQPKQDDEHDFGSPVVPSAGYLTVSKRIQRIALPTWTSRISCATHEIDRRLAALYLGKAQYDRVTHYGVVLRNTHYNVQLVVATSFERLERLDINLSLLGSSVDIVPALRRLKQLKRLSLFSDKPLHVDSTFGLSELPRLEHLTVSANEWSFALLQRGTGNLRSHLSIEAHVLGEKRIWEELDDILDLLSNSSLRRLELSSLPRFAPLSRLLRFVAAFPQLRQLDVHESYSVLEGDPVLFQTARKAISAIASLDNLAEHAVSLAALLFQLEAGTRVIRFGLREPDTGNETRFTRQGDGDKFEMEQWKAY